MDLCVKGSAYAYASNSKYPTSDKRVWSSDDAGYYGSNKHLGITATYYARCLGCGGAL
ncbi:hypothetical protein ACFSTA_02000 [Ornithinibacillus salinisoli]|uniref:Uncharacterized protein n=1 Tax=Ornithinibacillus salinisoli TaxID=1848459 RepID=A0ABW4VWJ7_9BACI